MPAKLHNGHQSFSNIGSQQEAEVPRHRDLQSHLIQTLGAICGLVLPYTHKLLLNKLGAAGYRGAMEFQNQIKRCLSAPSALSDIRSILAQSEETNRTGLAARLCRNHGFYDARGRPQLPGCLKALNELSLSGHFALPAPRSRPGPGAPRRLAEPLPPAARGAGYGGCCSRPSVGVGERRTTAADME